LRQVAVVEGAHAWWRLVAGRSWLAAEAAGSRGRRLQAAEFGRDCRRNFFACILQLLFNTFLPQWTQRARRNAT
jgi:hypothetical protein